MRRKNVDALYPLTPMQHALLLHSLHAPGEDPGALHIQARLVGPLNEAEFRDAWREVTRRHPALRTVVRWDGIPDPLQIVLHDAPIPLTASDLRGLDPEVQNERLIRHRDRDRRGGLDLRHPPSSRLALFRLADDEHHLIWTAHHVLLDGWSGALVLREVVALTNASARGERADLPPARPFRDGVRWLTNLPHDEAETFWRERLTGITAPTPLPARRSAPPAGPEHQADPVLLDRATSHALRATARQHQVTLSDALHAAWALLLHHASDEATVVFGSTSSGRSLDLPGIDGMVGMLINALPLRVEIDRATDPWSLVREVHAARAASVRHCHSAPGQIHAWSGFPPHQRLYRSLVVVENYPVEEEATGPLRLAHLESGITSAVPLTVLFAPGPLLTLRIAHDPHVLDSAAVPHLLDGLRRLLAGLAGGIDESIADLLDRTLATVPLRTTLAGPTPAQRAAPPAYVAPRSATERRLAAIWQDVLGVDRVGIGDSFFDLGGQSLQALHLLNRVETVFGQKTAAALLFEAPTIAQMAAALRPGEVPPSRSTTLVPLRATGSRRPLFCVHSYDGQALIYDRLARHLSDDQPVYGIEAVGLDGSEPVQTSVPAMAARYLRDLRAVQPRGPFALLTICFGIGVAFEMSRMLREQGETVSALIVLDSGFWPLLPPEHEREGATADAERSWISEAVERARQSRLVSGARRVRDQIHLARSPAREARLIRLRRSNAAVWRAHTPTPHSCPVTLIRSREHAERPDKAWHVSQWEALSGGHVTTRVVEGSHLSILQEPDVAGLAWEVDAALARALG